MPSARAVARQRKLLRRQQWMKGFHETTHSSSLPGSEEEKLGEKLEEKLEPWRGSASSSACMS